MGYATPKYRCTFCSELVDTYLSGAITWLDVVDDDTDWKTICAECLDLTPKDTRATDHSYYRSTYFLAAECTTVMSVINLIDKSLSDSSSKKFWDADASEKLLAHLHMYSYREFEV